jgi:hypothetical protein
MKADSCLPTYLKAAAFFVPAALALMFTMIFLVPKLEQISSVAGLAFLSGVNVFVQASRILAEYWLLFVAGIAVVLVALERRSSAWPRYRAGVVLGGTALLNCAVLVGLAGLLIQALVAAPALMHLR